MISSCSAKTWQIMKNIYSVYSIAYDQLDYGYSLPNVQSVVKLLGYLVSGEGIHTDPDKVQAIRDMAPPKNVHDVRRYLGMCGFYRSSMPHYAQTAEPLVELTRKHVRFQWDERRQKAFDELKQLLMSSHVMSPPDTTRPYKLYTDACNYAVGAILVQVDDKGVEKVIQYVSHVLSATQRRWATIEREAYAVVYSIKKLRHYLYGSQFTVLTDHKPLNSLFTKEITNCRIQRWAVLLAEYGAELFIEQVNIMSALTCSRVYIMRQNINMI